MWSGFNETNCPCCWLAGIHDMVRCSKHFYKLIKRLDSKARFIGPSAGSWNVPYVEEFLDAGGGQAIDGVDIHYNSQAGDMENMDFAGARREPKTVTRKHDCGEKPIWIRQFGFNPTLKRNTVTVMDDRQAGERASLQLSNFSVLEDRETKEIEIYPTRYSETTNDFWGADAYEYALRFLPKIDRRWGRVSNQRS